MEWLIMGLLTGWVYRQHNQIKELEGRLKRRDKPVVVNNGVTIEAATDAAARIVDKHVQEFHRR